MRVLGVYSTDRLLGGGEVSFTLTLKGLHQRGVEILALIPAEGELADYLSAAGIPYVTTPQESLRRAGTAIFLLRPHPAWLSVVRDFMPDIIHCNAMRPALYGQAVGRRLGIPVVLHARISEKIWFWDWFLMVTTQAVVCTSEVVRQRFPHWLAQKKVTVIPNPIDPVFLNAPAAHADELRKKWRGDSEGPVIGVVGRLLPIKGQHVVIHAAPEICKACPSARFVFIGAEDPLYPGYRDHLKAMIRRAGIESAFTFAGFQHDMLSAYRALDMVAFPATAEGFGRVIIEAGVLRKPVIAYDIPALREIMPESLCGFALVSSPHDLAARLIDLCRDPKLYESVSATLHEHVIGNFGIDSHVRRMEELYLRLMVRVRRVF